MEVSSRSINHLVEFGSEEGQPRMKEGGVRGWDRAKSETELRAKCPHLTWNNYKTRLLNKGPALCLLSEFVLVCIPGVAFGLQIYLSLCCFLLSFKHFMVSRSLNVPRSGFTLPVNDISPWH